MTVDLTHCLLQEISHRKDKCKTAEPVGATVEDGDGGFLGWLCGKWLEYRLLHCRIASFTTWESANGQSVQLGDHLDYPFRVTSTCSSHRRLPLGSEDVIVREAGGGW